MKQNILFVGCGKMGSAIVKNLVLSKNITFNDLTILKPTENQKIPSLKYVKTLDQLSKSYRADIIFLCVKPQLSQEVLEQISESKIFDKNTVFISIIAGKSTKFFEKFLGEKSKIIRTMPNLAIQVGSGIMPYFFNKNFTKTEQRNLKKIFEVFGTIFEVKDENQFDIITAIYGCGPAYIFLMQEIISELSTKNGIEKNLSDQLTKDLFYGSALLSKNSLDNFTTLRSSVTSKKGVTESALKVLNKNSALKKLFKNTIDEAIKKSKKLS